MAEGDLCRFGVLTASDRASAGDYDDLSGPAIVGFLEEALTSPWEVVRRLVPDDRGQIENALAELSILKVAQWSSPLVEQGRHLVMSLLKQPKQSASAYCRASANR